jgi:hypothetical protein
MKIFLQGEKGKAICYHCEKLVATTYQYRDVPFSDGIGIAKKILSGVCDICDNIVSIPASSTLQIKKARAYAVHCLKSK